jgi:SWI/SNF-related matrix-associated actin-dependent regulator of chromatin subfamily B member 1
VHTSSLRPPGVTRSYLVGHFPRSIINDSEYYHQMNQTPSYSSQERITPAMLAAFQNQKANLFSPQSSINPSHLQHNGIGGGSINPAALTAASPTSSFPQQQQHFNSMLQVVGITREQFQNLSPQERHSAGEKYRSVINAQQQMAMINAGLVNNNNAFSNQPQNQNFYDRPSSSASSHSQHQQSSSSRQPQPSSSTSHQMMPPPPPRPPTAQGHSSRPNTSQARSPTIPGSQQGQMLEMMQQGQQRSQSRMVCFYYTILPLFLLTLFQRLIEATQ